MVLLTETFNGAPGGMNLALPPESLQDSEARLIIDALIDQPGLVRRRGPTTAATGYPALSYKAAGMTGTVNPAGAFILGVLNGDATHGKFSVYSADRTTKVDLTWPFNLPNNPYYVVDAKPLLNGGVAIGVTDLMSTDATAQGLAIWRGGNTADYSTGTVSFTRGATSVTGSGTTWTSNVSPGQFLFANTDDPYTSAYIGVVQSVNSSTSITLEKPAPYTATAKAYSLKSLRGFILKVSKGRITTDTSSTTVTGATTKFSSQGLATGTWQLYRASDDSYIGKVSSVSSDTSLTLSANAAVACSNERFYALRADANSDIDTTGSTSKVGFLNASYSELQWYANNTTSLDKTERVWFSDATDPEAVDLSPFDGDFIPVPNSTGSNEPIMALLPCSNCLMVFKEKETWAIFGNSATTFNLRKIEDDGAISPGSVTPYGGGAIWAGRDGIYYFDGIQSKNITADKLGDWWKNSIRNFNSDDSQMYGTIIRDHYWLFVESINPDSPVVKGTTSVSRTRYTFVFNLASRALTLATNIDFRGAIQLPSNQGGTNLMVVNDSSKGVVIDARYFFDNTGVDTVTCESNTAGPDFFFESKKFDAGDAARKKLFKTLILHYFVQTGNISVDTVLGLNSIGQTASSSFVSAGYTWDTLANSVSSWNDMVVNFPTWNDVINSFFTAKKVKFQKRGQFMSFRLYQSTSAITKLTIGPYQLGYKLQRPGKV